MKEILQIIGTTLAVAIAFIVFLFGFPWLADLVNQDWKSAQKWDCYHNQGAWVATTSLGELYQVCTIKPL